MATIAPTVVAAQPLAQMPAERVPLFELSGTKKGKGCCQPPSKLSAKFFEDDATFQVSEMNLCHGGYPCCCFSSSVTKPIPRHMFVDWSTHRVERGLFCLKKKETTVKFTTTEPGIPCSTCPQVCCKILGQKSDEIMKKLTPTGIKILMNSLFSPQTECTHAASLALVHLAL
jgi:hypothetical protein